VTARRGAAAYLIPWEVTFVSQNFLAGTMLVIMLAAPPVSPRRGEPGPGLAAQQRAEAVVPLEGLDPVLLTRGQEKQGDEQFSVRRGRFRYLFAGAETKAAFEREPELYEVQLGGSCARMGPDVQGDPDLFLVHKGRIYIFGSPACVKAFKARPESFLDSENPETAAPPATEEALRRGRALIERAVEAAGGAARVDGVTSYVERGAVLTASTGGAREIKTAVFALYPDRVRAERTYPFGTIANVLTREGGFVSSPQGESELTEAQRDAADRQFKLGLLPLLRARRGEGFTAAALGAAGQVGQVEVSHGGLRARLGLDPSTGRVVSLSYRGRNPDGVVGRIVRTFSDFRLTGGLTLPFTAVETFEAESAPMRTLTVESITVNGEVAPALFERSKPSAAQ
jgi:YHS domain-containing protein